MALNLSGTLRELTATADVLARETLAPKAEWVDQHAEWPQHAMDALAEAGLMGLHVPRRLGGQEQGLLALVAVTETLARGCSSAAICFGMHCVATAVLAAKATPDQEERYLNPIAEGRHVTSLALSESGTGSHFYIPMTVLRREGDAFVVNGTKQFVTSGARADSYVTSTLASGPVQEAGEFNFLIVDKGTPGMRWLEPWNGVGMRGNSSRGLSLEDVRVRCGNLLGEEGDEIWYVFEVVAPYFLMAMSATYLGIAQTALDVTVQHLQARRYAHSSEALHDVSAVQQRLADMWTAVEKTRHLLYSAAQMGDVGDPQALTSILMSKADVAETAVFVTNEAMTLCGGAAYRENSKLSRLLRDARAAHVMAPVTDVLRQWTGRALLGLPLL